MATMAEKCLDAVERSFELGRIGALYRLTSLLADERKALDSARLALEQADELLAVFAVRRSASARRRIAFSLELIARVTSDAKGQG